MRLLSDTVSGSTKLLCSIPFQGVISPRRRSTAKSFQILIMRPFIIEEVSTTCLPLPSMGNCCTLRRFKVISLVLLNPL